MNNLQVECVWGDQGVGLISEEGDRVSLKNLVIIKNPEAEFKEFEPRLKFKPRLQCGWFHLKLYSIFQDLSYHSIETGFWQI